MKPPQAKNAEGIVREVEKWFDEYKECLGLGATEMGWDYQLAAMRSIATDEVREKMDNADALSGALMSHKDKYDAQYEVMMNWAHIRMKADKDKSTKSNKMDCGGMAGNEGWGEMDKALALIKGKVKGGFQGFGKGFGGKGKGFGFGKGFGGKGKGNFQFKGGSKGFSK